jgi:hypothetical protein
MDSIRIPIVFIHIGGTPPDYARIAVQQARRWNPSADIIFLSSVVPEEGYSVGEQWIALEDIPKAPAHIRFLQATTLDATWRGGFWRSTTERFFYLEDWMRSRGIEECFHLENDNTLYADISELLPTLRATTTGLSTVFQGQGCHQNNLLACFSVLYCKDVDALRNFLIFLAGNPVNKDDMQRGGDYWLENQGECFYLPCAPTGVKLISDEYRSWSENARFPCIFDSTAHGQYVCGVDPRNNVWDGPRYINRDADFRTDQFLYGWKADALGRRYPVLTAANGKEWKLANLHVHSKRLQDFI